MIAKPRQLPFGVSAGLTFCLFARVVEGLFRPKKGRYLAHAHGKHGRRVRRQVEAEKGRNLVDGTSLQHIFDPAVAARIEFRPIALYDAQVAVLGPKGGDRRLDLPIGQGPPGGLGDGQGTHQPLAVT